MKNGKVIFGKSTLLIILLAIFAVSAFAQSRPTWSRGVKELSISYDECVSRAKNALEAEGYSIENQGGMNSRDQYVAAAKDIHSSIIACNLSSNDKIWINVFVASISGDNNVTEAEKWKLLERMEESSANCRVPTISGTYLTTGDPVGIMVIDYQNGNYISARYGKDENSLVNRLAGNFKCNVLKGTYTNTIYNKTGTFKYNFSDDGSSFSGGWQNNGGGEGSTNGTRKSN